MTTAGDDRWPGAGDDLQLVHDWWADSPRAPASQQVLLASIALFAERGYHATTTRDIATRLGMSTGAMYAHYRSKEELLFDVCLTGHQRAVDALQAAIASSDRPGPQLAALVREFTAWHARHHRVARIVHYELYSLSGEHLTPVLEIRRTTQALIDDVLARGAAAGTFTVTDVARTGRALLSLCVDVARWYRGDDDPDELGEHYAGLALRMVSGG
ncbi:TetR/AcrR family transcriptional regulator [Pseudonocardia abyssalis]|uniref:TetR family transcriptional regulator n=1 Tax=Pseudonocardia abyssalis TaxID=2792008 RepID=A0ABS6URE8_9PSEU|nr:TetR/AcrR family transcriptional regulator [Pseudonocardia abyssalis]MBW0113765.1 TetR family transcriptional regulator [Pseudonocardia abyssalis]MBW0134838.1 TetR family transcriptional regulator [Pseudonocardia abyssalis]